jgi:hypothetical protein
MHWLILVICNCIELNKEVPLLAESGNVSVHLLRLLCQLFR